MGARTCYKANIIDNNKIKVEELEASERRVKEWYANS